MPTLYEDLKKAVEKEKPCLIKDMTYKQYLNFLEINAPDFLRQLRQDIYLDIFDAISKNGGGADMLCGAINNATEDLQKKWGIEDWYDRFLKRKD